MRRRESVDIFYKAMDEWYLNHDRKCSNCGDKMWICYGDGHIWDKCLMCPEPLFTLELAGYITDYDEPAESPPSHFEVRHYLTDTECLKMLKRHEKAYRKMERK